MAGSSSAGLMSAMSALSDVPSKASKSGTFLANWSIALVSTIVSYFIIEAFFFRVIFPVSDASVRPHLPETPGILAQSTKAGFVPHDYVAILGDSMAEGLGDALLAAGNNEARAFHAAHVVRDLTGRDVVSFGRGGSSSAEGLVRQPARILGGSHCLIFPTVEDPSRIVAYFYEGNDIQDNLAFAAKVAQKFGRSDSQAIDRFLSEDYAPFASWRCHLYLFDIASRMSRFFYKYYYVGVDPYQFQYTPGGSGLLVAGSTIDAPAPLDGPAIEVSDAGIRSGITVFERSLSWLKARFPNVPITVAYVPTALSIYQLTGPSYRYSIEPRDDGKSDWATVAQIARNSDLICNQVRAASAHNAVGFLDTRPALREAASKQLLHGPMDWVHFNEQGYRALGRALAGRLDLAAVDPCS
jgi:lysophospholipase L1-like esterase